MVPREMRSRLPLASLLILLPLMLLVASCAPKDPVERVNQARAKYQVRLNSWLVKPAPIVEVPENEGDTGEAAMAESAAVAEEVAAEGEEIAEEVMEVETGPTSTDVIFDLLVLFEGNDPLPGVTVEVIHDGAGGATKESRLQWIETGGLVRGDTRQVTIELEGWALEEGDSFGVSLRSVVPAEDRSQYREFAEAP